jgi:hypothetical protein
MHILFTESTDQEIRKLSLRVLGKLCNVAFFLDVYCNILTMHRPINVKFEMIAVHNLATFFAYTEVNEGKLYS